MGGTWSVHFGRPIEIVDEGPLFRIENLHIIEKFRVASVEKQNDRLLIHLKNGDMVILAVTRR